MKEPVNTWTHFVPFLAAVAGVGYLVSRTWGDVPKCVVMTVYGLSVATLFGASALYHWLDVGPRATAALRQLDRAAIYVMIAGSYTPILFFGLDGVWRTTMLAAIWTMAASGIALTLWFSGCPRVLSTAAYVAMGWVALVPLVQLVSRLQHTAIILIAVAGFLYTFGAVIYATKRFDFAPKRFGFHELFHLFVVGGAAVQYVAITIYVMR